MIALLFALLATMAGAASSGGAIHAAAPAAHVAPTSPIPMTAHPLAG